MEIVNRCTFKLDTIEHVQSIDQQKNQIQSYVPISIDSPASNKIHALNYRSSTVLHWILTLRTMTWVFLFSCLIWTFLWNPSWLERTKICDLISGPESWLEIQKIVCDLTPRVCKKDAFGYTPVMAAVLCLISFRGFLQVKLSKLLSSAEESDFFFCSYTTSLQPTTKKKIKSSL